MPRRPSIIDTNDPPRTSCPSARCKPFHSGRNVSYWIVAAILVTLACLAYSASLRGPLLFDDLTLPLASPLLIGEPLLRRISGVRPLLMFTYWINYDPAASTLSYHLTNVLMHACNAILVFCLCQTLFRAVHCRSHSRSRNDQFRHVTIPAASLTNRIGILRRRQIGASGRNVRTHGVACLRSPNWPRHHRTPSLPHPLPLCTGRHRKRAVRRDHSRNPAAYRLGVRPPEPLGRIETE